MHPLGPFPSTPSTAPGKPSHISRHITARSQSTPSSQRALGRRPPPSVRGRITPVATPRAFHIGELQEQAGVARLDERRHVGERGLQCGTRGLESAVAEDDVVADEGLGGGVQGNWGGGGWGVVWVGVLVGVGGGVSVLVWVHECKRA